jgi:hypothetical protein
MADSQIANLDNATSLAALIHENYVSDVMPHLDKINAVAAIFDAAGPGEFSMVGEKLVFAGDLTFSGGAMGTTGWLPDHEYIDPVRFESTPARVYVRRAVDNFWQARAVAPGAFEDFSGRVMEQLWDAFDRATCRHVHGGSTATVCTCSSRTSQTVIVVKDGYGHVGTSPVMYLEPGMTLAWHDASNSFVVEGTATISSINYSTNTITFAANFDDGVTTIAAGDPIVFATTPSEAADHFVTERGNAPGGLMDIIDPDQNNASYLGVTESTNPRWKPVRIASSDFGEVEIMSFVKQIAAKSQSQITASTNVMACQPAATMELARTLIPFTQINQKGQTLNGGWDTVRIGQYDFVEDNYNPHDVLYCICMEDMAVVNLDGEASLWAGDGSEWSRLADYDGREVFAKHYVQRLPRRRNRSGALTGITLTDGAQVFSPDPNY